MIATDQPAFTCAKCKKTFAPSAQRPVKYAQDDKDEYCVGCFEKEFVTEA